MNREDFLRQLLADLHREYRDRAQPIVDEIVKIECAKPPKPIIAMFDEMGRLIGFGTGEIDVRASPY